MTHVSRILTLNAGSSSLKAAVYAADSTETLVAAAHVERLGVSDGRLRIFDAAGRLVNEQQLHAGDHATALSAVLEWLERNNDLRRVDVVAHRVVHGGRYAVPQRITPDVTSELRRLTAVDPDHLPQALAAIDAIGAMYPDTPQVACFDTTFHQTMSAVARRYPLPSRFNDAGVQRYGFHGLSCEYIVGALETIDPAAAAGRLIVAHLGNGASLTAVYRGACVDTTMGFSPAGGVMMGTRTGDLDPGVLLYALREERMTEADLNRLINREAGLLGVSGTTSDMEELLTREPDDPRAAAAIDLFCYLVRKAMGAMLVALGGLDTLVFTGGIGGHSAPIRERITRGLEWMGLTIDSERNAATANIISPDARHVVVRVIQTNEDLVLARHARRLLAGNDSLSP